MQAGHAVKNITRCLVLIVIGLMPIRAFALLDSCTVANVPVAFGSYNAFGGAALDTTGQISVSCTGVTVLGIVTINAPYTISLSQGGGASYSPRKMSLLSNRLNYNLYTDSARSIIWGDGTGGTSTVSGTASCSGLLTCVATNNHVVYGRIPASQNVPIGAYSDSITVTVNY